MGFVVSLLRKYEHLGQAVHCKLLNIVGYASRDTFDVRGNHSNRQAYHAEMRGVGDSSKSTFDFKRGLNGGADKERGWDRVLITLVLRHLASNHHHVDPTSGSRCANKLTDQASYDPRRVFRFALPDIHVGPKTRSIGTYLSGGLVSVRPACHRSGSPCTLDSPSKFRAACLAVRHSMAMMSA